MKTFIILLAVPFSAIGAVWLLYLLGYNMSIAVWVGLIALLGVDAETAVFMLLYLDLAYHEAQKKGQMRNWDDLCRLAFLSSRHVCYMLCQRPSAQRWMRQLLQS